MRYLGTCWSLAGVLTISSSRLKVQYDMSALTISQLGGPSERLDSWKEIAGYLKHTVRTVQRWEARECLPVRRFCHNRQASVYAFRRELDAWRERKCITHRNHSLDLPGRTSEFSRLEGGRKTFGLVIRIEILAATLPAHSRIARTRREKSGFAQLWRKGAGSQLLRCYV
jgi:hypothetical protein